MEKALRDLLWRPTGFLSSRSPRLTRLGTNPGALGAAALPLRKELPPLPITAKCRGWPIQGQGGHTTGTAESPKADLTCSGGQTQEKD